MPKIYPICEGPGEKDAVPTIIKKILQHLDIHDVFVGNMQNVHGKGALTKEWGVERFVQRAQMWPGCDGILVLIDADEECPLERALDFATRLEGFGNKCPIAIVLANRAFENWFLASIESLRGKDFGDGRPGLRADAPFSNDYEESAGAKNKLTHLFPGSTAYKETLDQVCLCQLIDIDLTRERSRSFRRLCEAVEWLAEQVRAGEKGITPIPDTLRERLTPTKPPPLRGKRSRKSKRA